MCPGCVLTVSRLGRRGHARNYDAVLDGIKLYYEVYGVGELRLLLHGNGASIANFKAQIDYFPKPYKMIAIDTPDQGQSCN